MSTLSIDRVYIAIHQTALDAKGGVSGLARRLGKREGTMHGKVNPTDETHEPSIGDFVAILDDVGDTTPLDVLCGIFGGQFTTKTQASGASIMSAVLRAGSEQGDVSRVIEAALADGELTDAERVKIKREIDEARKALTMLENTINDHAMPVAFGMRNAASNG